MVRINRIIGIVFKISNARIQRHASGEILLIYYDFQDTHLKKKHDY